MLPFSPRLIVTEPWAAGVAAEGVKFEVRAVGEETPSKTIGDLIREIGPWEGETGADLDALFTRQPGNRHVPDLP